MNRISNKQVYRAWTNRRDELKDFEIWKGLNYWFLYQGQLNGIFINEKLFKGNRAIYDYLLFRE